MPQGPLRSCTTSWTPLKRHDGPPVCHAYCEFIEKPAEESRKRSLTAQMASHSSAMLVDILLPWTVAHDVGKVVNVERLIPRCLTRPPQRLDPDEIVTVAQNISFAGLVQNSPTRGIGHQYISGTTSCGDGWIWCKRWSGWRQCRQ